MSTRIIRFLAVVGMLAIGYVVESIHNKSKDIRRGIDNKIDDAIDDILNDDDYYDYDYDFDCDNITYLTAKDIKQIRWMSVSQIRSIFGKRHGKIKVANSEEAYKELRWMSEDQLKALFG